jgi:hypothetical protein
MNYLLFGGASSVGKSEAITRLKRYLDLKGMVTVNRSSFPNGNGDFYACLDGTNTAGSKIRILISSTADDGDTIQGFKEYCDSHGPCDIIISAIRDAGDRERANFFSIMDKIPSDFIVEIPMGKITKRNARDKAMKWYRNAIDDVAHKVLSNAPFNLFSINDI